MSVRETSLEPCDAYHQVASLQDDGSVLRVNPDTSLLPNNGETGWRTASSLHSVEQEPIICNIIAI